MSNVLILLGMHRSGTSLLTKWLQSCDLEIGSESHTGGQMNPSGNHEDRDFLSLHIDILRSNQAKPFFWVKPTLDVFPRFEAKAQELIDKQNSRHANWGWKDPRTCLLIDFWNELIPHSKKLMVYRTFNDVVESLVRRKKKKIERMNQRGFTRNVPVYNEEKDPNKFLASWVIYNRGILKEVDRDGDSSLLLNTNDYLQHSVSIINYVNENWGFGLTPTDINEVYDSTLFKKQADMEFDFDPKHLDAANRVWDELEEIRNDHIERLS